MAPARQAEPRTVLAVDNLSIGLPPAADRQQAVSNLSFDVRAGEVVCIVGESGSGKSVTALAALGLLPDALSVSDGDIRIGGASILQMPRGELRRLRGERIGMIFQEPMTALNPIARVGRQVEEMFVEHTDLPGAERRARVFELLTEVKLDPERIAPSFPHQLSGGQLQRIMIAMALALKPALLIADEPTTALDVTTQAQVLRLLRDLQEKTGTAVLFITHDFGVVADIADRVLVMRHGIAVETGSVRKVLSEPTDDYTRQLIAAVPSGRAHARPKPTTRSRVLDARALTKTYVKSGLFRRSRFAALKSVSLQIDTAEIVGVVGESGSGKTTLARCVAQLVPVDSGNVEIDGVDMSSLSGDALRKARALVQTVFQNPFASLNPRIRVGQTIAQGPVNFGTPRREALAAARDLLEQVGLDRAAVGRFPWQFSGGQRQRIALARALVMKPKLLIADEAVSALDVSIQRQIIDLLRGIREREGIAILFITHDLRVAAELCDRIIVMKNGEIVEQGPAQQLITVPKDPYTQLLLDAVPGRHWLRSVQKPASIAGARDGSVQPQGRLAQ